MAMSKIERIDKEIQKTREKITEYQNRLRGLEAQKTEAENLQIVQLVRSMRLTPQELTAMLAGGGIPGIAPMPADYEEQEDNADEEWIYIRSSHTLDATWHTPWCYRVSA